MTRRVAAVSATPAVDAAVEDIFGTAELGTGLTVAGVALADRAARYLTDEPNTLRYARDVLRGTDAPVSGDELVDVVTSPEALTVLVAAAADRPPEYCRPTRSSRMRVLRHGEDRLYFDTDAVPDHVVRHGPGRLTVAAIPGPDRCRFGVRYLRELWYRQLRAEGFSCFHASSVRMPSGGVVLLVGDSGAGKTTLALALCVYGGGELVANERTLVRPNDDGIEVVGLPSAIRLDDRTVRMFGWQNWIGQPCWNPERNRKAKLERLPGELARWTGIGSSCGGPLEAVLLPGPELAGTGWIEGTAEHVRETLRRNCYSPVDPLWPEDWLGIGDTSTASTTTVVPRLIAGTRFMTCRTAGPPSTLVRHIDSLLG
ncbi:hypothetical protein [Nocardia sp. N2S4-5]|uniref:hypothetical protein n=1 Tax=Nocardia sp. N2S4-5 TaxID=3351565 RepID=UPI0037D6F3B4